MHDTLGYSHRSRKQYVYIWSNGQCGGQNQVSLKLSSILTINHPKSAKVQNSCLFHPKREGISLCASSGLWNILATPHSSELLFLHLHGQQPQQSQFPVSWKGAGRAGHWLANSKCALPNSHKKGNPFHSSHGQIETGRQTVTCPRIQREPAVARFPGIKLQLPHVNPQHGIQKATAGW